MFIISKKMNKYPNRKVLEKFMNWQHANKEIQMLNEHLRQYQMTVITKETYIKTRRNHFHLPN